MDRRSQTSLIYRIITEAIVISLGVSVIILAMVPELKNMSALARGLSFFVVISTSLLMIWWRLASMMYIGILRRKTGVVLNLILFFNVLLLQYFCV